MKIENIEKNRRYLAEALKASYGCNSATCGMNPPKEGQVGTANLCRCEYVYETMIGALAQNIGITSPEKKEARQDS